MHVVQKVVARDRWGRASGRAAQRAVGSAVLGLFGATESLHTPHAQLTELRLRETEMTVEVVELLLETCEPVEVLVGGVGSHGGTVRLPSAEASPATVEWLDRSVAWGAAAEPRAARWP